MFNIYGNEQVLSVLSNMKKLERFPHAFCLFGDKGLGKKTMATYISALILCEEKGKSPCLKCKSCRMMLSGVHPDVRTVSHNSEEKGFSVGNLREIVADSYIFPNDGEKKIYILQDCENMQKQAQNALLKIIEEPPKHCVFIFTAKEKETFLPTIISRVVSFKMGEISYEECKNALLQKEFTDEGKVLDAMNAFGANIGMCVEYLTNEEFEFCVNACKNIVDSITLTCKSTNEYGVLQSFFCLDRKKESAKITLAFLLTVLRDARVAKAGSEVLKSCYKEGGKALSKVISARKIDKIYRVITNSLSKIEGNGNLSLALTCTASEIQDIIEN